MCWYCKNVGEKKGNSIFILLKLSLNLLVVLFPFSRKMKELSGEATS